MMHGSIEGTRLLLASGADEGLANKGEVTPLDLATDPTLRAAVIEAGVRLGRTPCSPLERMSTKRVRNLFRQK